MDTDGIHSLLEQTQVIAVVGASDNAAKAAHVIPAILIEAGFTVVPVNPGSSTILGRTSYPALADIPFPVDMVNVFRPSRDTPEIARQAVAINATSLWLQQGIASDEARAIAEAGGLTYVEDHCLGVSVRVLGVRKE